MTDKTLWESFKAEGTNVIDRIQAVIKAGNLRRVVIEHGGKTIAEFPLTAGVVGVVVAPVLAAIGALVVLLKECTIHLEVDAPVTAGAATGAASDHAPLDNEC
jgi:hypothetical protein